MSKVIQRIEDKQRFFVIIQFLTAIYAIFILSRVGLVSTIFSVFGSFTGTNFTLLTFSKFFTGVLYLLFPTVLLGASFPLAYSLIKSKLGEAAKNVGLLYSWDTFGAIGGALMAGFIFLPTYGLKVTCLVGASFNLLSGFLVVKKNKKNLVVMSIGLLLILGLLAVSNLFNEKYVVNSSEQVASYETENNSEDKENPTDNKKYSLYERFDEREILFVKNSPYGEVGIIYPNETDHRALYINRRMQCRSDSYSEREIANIAIDQLGNNLEVLNIGLGCGFTLDRILSFDTVKKVDIVEINPVVVEANKFFSEENHYALEDKRTNLIIGDGAEYLRRTDGKYDAIIIDIENPSIIHSSPLYTVEYFKEISEHLEKDGIFGLWAYHGGEEYASIIYHSLRQAFDYVYCLEESTKNLVFFTSNNKLNLDMTSGEIEQNIKFENEKEYELNTLDHPILQRYFKEG